MSAQQERGWRGELATAEDTDPPSGAERAGARPLLVGNNIENPGNVAALRAAADMFDWECSFLPDDRHPDARAAAAQAGARIIDARELADAGVTVIALENADGAQDLFRFRPPKGRYAVVAGNERRGIAGDVLRLADRVVQIPNLSVHVNTLNVAAAAAIALHQLSRGRGGAGVDPRRGRPSILLAGPTDAIETGSVVRSAACFGWSRLFIDDHHRVWFDTDRVTRSLGRGAARRGRNPIRVQPAPDEPFEEVCVVGASGEGEPLRSAPMVGSDRLVVIPDEPDAAVSWERFGRRVRRVSLDVAPGARPHLRLVASIVLAEIARQLGEGVCMQPRCRGGPS